MKYSKPYMNINSESYQRSHYELLWIFNFLISLVSESIDLSYKFSTNNSGWVST